ncbi:hypothetical protein N7462_007268 [Penicillium macrosclerotiorum]|uniref:uncharacterized protein n=1 Tax=Penicillium macrosclerotiorum TaxID=303699 RepID=UPI002548C292|nr:uncharacterized protein N7462_007268 [Penicillium macrosclerotiorum]KAJ5679024.1 hypothetical protein N7462_007268 [Penicillium macrosclerotiorum]
MVREISLYSSGNFGVLMGWASAEGFGNRQKFPELKKINLFVRQGPEGRERLLEYIRQFKEQLGKVVSDNKAFSVGKNYQKLDDYIKRFSQELRRWYNATSPDHNIQLSLMNLTTVLDETALTLSENCTQFICNREASKSEGIEVLDILDQHDFKYATGFATVGGRSNDEHPWIQVMKDFSQSLRNFPSRSNPAPVKIAIIDDGIDTSQVHIRSQIALGKSFFPYPNSSEFMNSYFVPSGQHGTQMAVLIDKICPNALLFIARLEERPATDGNGRRIAAKSAADAIKWAVKCEVDIISMSWTIEESGTDKKVLEDLKTQLDSANEKGILMFCASSDQGESRHDQSYPGKFPGICFRIGGASPLGDKLPWVNTESIDFLCPGAAIPFHGPDGLTYESGSSLATACASDSPGGFYKELFKELDKRQLPRQKQPFPLLCWDDYMENALSALINKLNVCAPSFCPSFCPSSPIDVHSIITDYELL